MSELWRDLIRKEDAKLAEELAVSRVDVSRMHGTMCVHLSCGRIVA